MYKYVQIKPIHWNLLHFFYENPDLDLFWLFVLLLLELLKIIIIVEDSPHEFIPFIFLFIFISIIVVGFTYFSSDSIFILLNLLIYLLIDAFQIDLPDRLYRHASCTNDIHK